MIGRLRAFWSSCQPRERFALGLVAALLALALLDGLALEPALSGLARLQRRLPIERAQAAQLEALLAEARGLRGRPPVAALPPAQARGAIESSLASAGLAGARTELLERGDFRITFTEVSFARWATWLAATERELGGHAVAVQARAGRQAGNVDLELTLRLERR